MLTKDYVKAVSQYLFHEDVDKDVFSSIYFGEVDANLKGSVAEIAKKAIDILPNYCRFDLNFAYSYTLQLQQTIKNASAMTDKPSKGGETPKTGKVAERQEQAVEQALEATMQQYGMEQQADGLKHQDDLHKEAMESQEVVLGGLLANQDPTPVDVAYQVKKIDASAKKIEKTLRNVSAVAESLVKGIEKVKSEWAETGYDYGRELALMDASEFATLADETTKKLWLLKYAKGELLQESSQDRKGLGDLIIAVDTSGSTSGRACHGNLVIDVEMGIALAMSKLAIKNKCKVSMCFHTVKTWGHSDGYLRSNAELNTYFAEKLIGGRLSTGDNNFDDVLTEIFEPLQGMHAGKRKPGVIFITDGYCRLSQKTQNLVTEIKKQTGIKLYSYFVSDNDPRNYAKELCSISDGNYWIDTDKPIEGQINCFVELI